MIIAQPQSAAGRHQSRLPRRLASYKPSDFRLSYPRPPPGLARTRHYRICLAEVAPFRHATSQLIQCSQPRPAQRWRQVFARASQSSSRPASAGENILACLHASGFRRTPFRQSQGRVIVFRPGQGFLLSMIPAHDNEVRARVLKFLLRLIKALSETSSALHIDSTQSSRSRVPVLESSIRFFVKSSVGRFFVSSFSEQTCANIFAPVVVHNPLLSLWMLC